MAFSSKIEAWFVALRARVAGGAWWQGLEGGIDFRFKAAKHQGELGIALGDHLLVVVPGPRDDAVLSTAN